MATSLRYLKQNAVAFLALFVALGGTGAYAAATIGSAEIVDESITSADIKNGEVRLADIAVAAVTNAKIASNAVTSARVRDNALVGDDIDESTLAVTQGAGTRVLANRLVLVPGQDVQLFEIPGLGEIRAYCESNNAGLTYVNTTDGPTDTWSMRDSGSNFGQITPAGHLRHVGWTESFGDHGHFTEFSVGSGNSPGPRRMATLHGFALQASDGQPCGIQASGTYWSTAG